MTALILVGGLVLLLVVGRTENQRDEALNRVEVGDRAADVTGILGVEPTRCEVGTLAHLRESFGEGWPAAAVDVALEQLASQTAERWVYPLSGEAPDCGGEGFQTELGVGANGEIVWWISVVGHSMIELPPTVTPAGVDSTAA